jgi:hypothetical protein
MKIKRIILSIFIVLVSLSSNAQIAGKWSLEKALSWHKENPWINGANFIPSTAINQLEMWQASSFDPETIDRELGWAEGLGFNTMRVYLHSLAYKQDPSGFKNRVSQYLSIADKHKINALGNLRILAVVLISLNRRRFFQFKLSALNEGNLHDIELLANTH